MKKRIGCFVLLVAAGARLIAQPQSGTVLWTYDVGNTINCSPAMAKDGTIYVGTSAGLSAITNNATVASNKWTFSAAVTYGSPAIANDGTVYSGSSDGNLYAINPDGSMKWSYQVQATKGSPAIGLDGTIYFAGSTYLYAIGPSGTLKWQSGGPADDSSPAIGQDGTVYVSSYAFEPDGTLKWVGEVQSNTGDSPALGADGTIYITGGFLYAFTPQGTNLWHTGSFASASPIVGKDGTIYVRGFVDEQLHAVSPGGQILWGAAGSSGRAVPTSPALANDGTIYYCASNSVFALSSSGDLQWVVYGGDSLAGVYLATTSPIVGPDGTIYAALGSKLYAIAGTNKLADSSWPMYRQNPRHTGKVEKPSLQQPKKRADANFEFQLYAQIDQTQTVQTSTDLVSWSPLTNIAVTNVPMDVVDLCASNFPTRFYRTLSQ